MTPARYETVLAAIVLAAGVVLALVAPRFFERGNLIDLLLANLPVLLAAIGATLVMLAGDIDISVGSQFAVCSVAAGALASAGVPMPAVAAATLLAGAFLGLVNGVLVADARIPSIVVTLATMVALRDGLRWITEGAWIQSLPPGFQWFGLTQDAFPAVVLAGGLGLTAAVAWACRRTRAGRAVYATGSSAEAARLAAIDTVAVRRGVFVAAGTCAALAGLVNAVRFSQIPSNTGLGLEMKVIAAVVVGGTAITGGRGTVVGTVLGVVLLGMSGPALTFLGASAYWERALQGAIILVAVGVPALGRVRAARAPRHGAPARAS